MTQTLTGFLETLNKSHHTAVEIINELRPRLSAILNRYIMITASGRNYLLNWRLFQNYNAGHSMEPTEPNKFLLKMCTTAQNRFRLIHTSIFNELRVYLKDLSPGISQYREFRGWNRIPIKWYIFLQKCFSVY